MTLEDEIALNRSAIGYIQSGLEAEAIRLIHTSWTTINLSLPSDLRNVNDEGETRRSGDEAAVAAHANVPPLLLPLVPVVTVGPFMTTSVAVGEDDIDASLFAEPADSCFTLFDRAFDFCPTLRITSDICAGRSSSSSSSNSHRMCSLSIRRMAWLRCASFTPAVLCCNAGLAHHRLALRNESAVNLFAEALSYYDTTFQVLSYHMKNHLYDPEMDILFMALINNMGHCFARLRDRGRMLWCYDQLLLMFGSSTQKHRMTHEEREFFNKRILLGAEFLQQPAPAA